MSERGHEHMSETRRPLGANMKRLLATKIAQDAIPTNGGFADGLEFLMSPERMAMSSQAAMTWIEQAIAAVKAAPDNPYGDDDEAIASEILRRIDTRG